MAFKVAARLKKDECSPEFSDSSVQWKPLMVQSVCSVISKKPQPDAVNFEEHCRSLEKFLDSGDWEDPEAPHTENLSKAFYRFIRPVKLSVSLPLLTSQSLPLSCLLHDRPQALFPSIAPSSAPCPQPHIHKIKCPLPTGTQQNTRVFLCSPWNSDAKRFKILHLVKYWENPVPSILGTCSWRTIWLLS